MTAIDFPNSPSTNDTFSSGGVTWRYDGTKWRIDAVPGPTYVTTLPTSPVDGQEIYYAADATNGVIWHLRYRSGGGTYKWEFVGGSALRGEDNDFRAITNQTAFVSLPTDPIAVSIPLAGEYAVLQTSQVLVPAGANNFGGISLAITNASDTVQTAATDSTGEFISNPTGDGGTGSVAVAHNIYTITTAGWKLREQARTGGNYTCTFGRRRIIITPVRVG